MYDKDQLTNLPAEITNDLLEACKALLNTFEHVARNDPHFFEQGYGSELLPILFAQARSAIAKAEA